jgi:hypothetical protein
MVKKFESINMVELAVKAEKKAMEKIIEKESNMNKKIKEQEIKNLKDAKEKGEVYISPEIVAPIRIEELFLKALQQSIEEDKRKGK